MLARDYPYCNLSLLEMTVILKLKEDAVVDVKEATAILRTADELANNQPYCILTDARTYFTITPEARQIFADKKFTGLVTANAVIVNNLAAKLVANFFSRFNRPHFYFQVFSNEEKAKLWLKEKIKPAQKSSKGKEVTLI